MAIGNVSAEQDWTLYCAWEKQSGDSDMLHSRNASLSQENERLQPNIEGIQANFKQEFARQQNEANLIRQGFKREQSANT